MQPTVRACLLALSIVALPALAADPRGSAGVYVEADNDDGFGVAADLTVHATERTSWYATASHADVSSGLAAASRRGLETGLYHDFGDIGLDAALGAWSNPGLVDARHLRVSLDWHGPVWSVALLGQRRRSEFDPFQASGTVTLRDGRQVTLLATADCETDDTGLGLRLAFTTGAWDGYVRGMSYEYDETACRFSSPGLETLARARPEIFRQFAPFITAQLSAYAATRVGVENTLLKDSFSVGAGYMPGRIGFGLDYDHHREFFGGLSSDTLSARATFVLTDTLDLSLALGATGGDSFDTVVFAGIGLRTQF